MGATCARTKLLNNKQRRNGDMIKRTDGELLEDYPNLIDIKGIRCFTSFTESNKTGNPFPII